ncbi:MAG: cysteine--tRNA ligase [Candidatus Woesearchaeota archaeon]
MKLKLYNTLTRKKEEFTPMDGNHVGFYSCGPTVYNYAHIGNLRTYVFNDVLKRILKYNNFDVKHVMNITDVGHLTDDADSGEDKMEKGAKREGKTVWDIAEYYTQAFKDDINKLNILEPDVWPKATDHVQEMIDINTKIEENGYAYKGENGNLYFDTSKFKTYGELAKLNLEQLNEGARADKDPNKKNPTDFVLWFTLEGSKFGESHSMKWDSPWGVGYPGWHIECCAMSSKYLGTQFDIHTGGIDHIPVHHTNEIAQAEAAFSVHPWVKYWLHGNFLVVEKGKMAKSGENFLTLKLLEDKGYDPLAYRFFCLGAHYRSELKFTWESLDSAKAGFERLKKRIIQLKKELDSENGSNLIDPYLNKFDSAINDDMNMPVALSVVQELLNDNSVNQKAKYDALLKFDSVLGFNIDSFEEEKVSLDAELEKLVEERNLARKNKDWAKADQIRDELKARGYELIDTPEGTKCKKI